MSRTKKQKPRQKKVRNFHALNAIQRKGGSLKNKQDKRVQNKKQQELVEQTDDHDPEWDEIEKDLEDQAGEIFDESLRIMRELDLD